MSSVDIDKSQAVGGQGAGGRRALRADNGSLRTWIAICAAVGLACGLLGWTIGAGRQPATTPKPAAAATKPVTATRARLPDVTNTPFGAADESAATAPAHGPALPFTLLRAYADQNQPHALLERDGQRFVARGVAVYGDYLIQVEPDQVVFIYLPSATRQRVLLSNGAPGQPQVPPPARAAVAQPLNRVPVPTRPASVERGGGEQSESN